MEGVARVHAAKVGILFVSVCSCLQLLMGIYCHANLVLSLLSQNPRHLGVLEIGTYWGTTCLRLAHALHDVPITTLELDPVHVAIARVLCLD